MVAGIYAWYNLLTAKRYIGSTDAVAHRRSQHLYLLRRGKHSNKHLQHAWNKDGEDNFEFQVLQVVECVDQLLSLEQFWIDKYVAPDELYNMLTVKRACGGRVVSAAQREHHSQIMKGRKQSPEVVEARVSGLRGRKQTPEEISKRVAARIANNSYGHSVGTRSLLRERRLAQECPRTGKKHTEETKRKMRETRQRQYREQ